MRIGLVLECKAQLPRRVTDPGDVDSELLAAFEEDELFSALGDAGHDVLVISDSVALLYFLSN